MESLLAQVLDSLLANLLVFWWDLSKVQVMEILSAMRLSDWLLAMQCQRRPQCRRN